MKITPQATAAASPSDLGAPPQQLSALLGVSYLLGSVGTEEVSNGGCSIVEVSSQTPRGLLQGC